jgi:hypothetical protein
MTRGPGWLFVAGLVVFALLGLLAGSPPSETPRDSTQTQRQHDASDAPPLQSHGSKQERREPKALATVSTSSPRSLARSWGRAWSNWSARTLAGQLAVLRRSASPVLAAELDDAVGAARAGKQLAPEQTGSRGVVVVTHVGRGREALKIVVVTREAPYGPAGPDPTGFRYRVYVGVARLESTGRWRMERWERQP